MRQCTGGEARGSTQEGGASYQLLDTQIRPGQRAGIDQRLYLEYTRVKLYLRESEYSYTCERNHL